MVDSHEVKVFVKVGSRVIDSVVITEEDYGDAMARLSDWADESFARKNL